MNPKANTPPTCAEIVVTGLLGFWIISLSGALVVLVIGALSTNRLPPSAIVQIRASLYGMLGLWVIIIMAFLVSLAISKIRRGK